MQGLLMDCFIVFVTITRVAMFAFAVSVRVRVIMPAFTAIGLKRLPSSFVVQDIFKKIAKMAMLTTIMIMVIVTMIM